MEKRYLRKDGRPIWVRRTLSLARSAGGDPLYFILVADDITARKEAEARDVQALAAREAEDALRSAEALYGYGPYLDRVPHCVVQLVELLGGRVVGSAPLVTRFAAGWSAAELAGAVHSVLARAPSTGRGFGACQHADLRQT